MKKVKKRSLLLLLLCIPCLSPAQSQLKSALNLPRAGDGIFKQQVEYKDPGRSGENVLWDFSRLNVENDEYELQYSSLPDSVIVGTEHHTRYYYSLSGDSLLCHGYENGNTIMTYSRPELQMKFPVYYKDSTFCFYNGNGKYCDQLNISAMGTFTTKSDAYGMMILPGGDTLKNVIRMHTRKRIAEETKPLRQPVPLWMQEEDIENLERVPSTDSINYRLANDTVLLEVETYRWYAAGYRYPVFETVKSITKKRGKEREIYNTAFFYPPQAHYYLEDDEENQKIIETQNHGKKDNPLTEGKYNVFPNPVSTTLEVEIFIPVGAKIKIQVRSVANKSVYINENKGKFAAGSHRFQFNVSKLPQGFYIVNIWADNYLFTETILKQ